MHKAKDDIMIFSRNQRRQENYALVLAPYLRDCVRGGVLRGLGGTVWLRGVHAVLNRLG